MKNQTRYKRKFKHKNLCALMRTRTRQSSLRESKHSQDNSKELLGQVDLETEHKIQTKMIKGITLVINIITELIRSSSKLPLANETTLNQRISINQMFSTYLIVLLVSSNLSIENSCSVSSAASAVKFMSQLTQLYL